MSRQLTSASTLDNLKKEAKRWLKALRAGDAEARARLDRAYPAAPAEPGLRHVQHALAREHGLAGWMALKDALADFALASRAHAERVAWFLENACPDHHVRGGPDHVMARHTAMRILSRHPEIARDSIYTAVVCGELAEVERILSERPEAASEKSSATSADRAEAGGSGDRFRKTIGPKGWEPLLYLCFTRLPLASANDNAVAIARALLDRGADPNAYFMAGDSRYTPLVGVIGEGEENRPAHPQREALTRLLLERGADPYDIQVFYNVHFHGDLLWFLKLIHVQTVKSGRQADWDDPEWSMIDMGGFGLGARFLLGIAIQKNDLELAEWLLAHGASPNAAPAPGGKQPKRSLHEEALRRGHKEMADLLVRYGATPSVLALEGEEAFAAACLQLDREKARTLLAGHPEYLRAPGPMFVAAERDRADVVTFLLDLGMSPDVQDAPGQRALHVAAYNDSVHVAELLIKRGAAIDPVDSMHDGTPLWWAMWGQRPRTMELLSRFSRDVWALSFTGNVERLREVLTAEPRLARLTGSGTTPLMWLPGDEARAKEIVELFLAHGADPTIRNKDGMTAADLASKRGLDEAAELLRARIPKTRFRMIKPRELESDKGRDIWDTITAAAAGDMPMLRRLLERDPSLSQAEYWYTQPIHFAVRAGHLEAVQILLESGGDPEWNGYHDGSLIEMARDRRHERIAQLLEEARNRRGRVAPAEHHPIHVAAQADDIEGVRKFLDDEPNLLERGDPSGGTPLHRAVLGSARRVIELLLDRGANIHAMHSVARGGRGGWWALDLQAIDLAIWGSNTCAPPKRDFETARLLVARGAAHDLTIAAALGDVQRVTALLDEDPSRIREKRPNGKHPLSAAVEFGHEALARVLLARGADPRKGTALPAAAHAGDRALVELLLAHGADPNGAVYAAKTPELRALLMAHGGTLDPYELVWMDQDDEVIRRVKADPSSAECGCGCVFTAVCTLGKRELLLRLLDAGIRVPPVLTACRGYLLENTEMFRILLDGGMNPDLPNWQRQTFLHDLCRGGKRGQIGRQLELAAILLDAGASISAREEEYGSTPLGWAARTNMPEMVEFLLARGAPTNLPDDQPWATPLSWAERRGHAEVAEILRKHGAAR